MENFSDFENKSYVEAKKVDYKFKDILRFTLKSISNLTQILLVLIFEIFVQLWKVVSPVKPKNISGQVALVTGAIPSS